MAKGLRGKRAEIEVESMELRDQIEVEWVPLLGITYDPKSDIPEIALDGLERLVSKPQQIFVDVRGAGLDSFEVIDSRCDPPYRAAPRATHASSAAKGWRLTWPYRRCWSSGIPALRPKVRDQEDETLLPCLASANYHSRSSRDCKAPSP